MTCACQWTNNSYDLGFFFFFNNIFLLKVIEIFYFNVKGIISNIDPLLKFSTTKNEVTHWKNAWMVLFQLLQAWKLHQLQFMALWFKLRTRKRRNDPKRKPENMRRRWNAVHQNFKPKKNKISSWICWWVQWPHGKVEGEYKIINHEEGKVITMTAT